LLTQAAQQTDQLSEVLYKNGGASYFQVLTSETNYFSAELNLVQQFACVLCAQSSSQLVLGLSTLLAEITRVSQEAVILKISYGCIYIV
jgi:hypothetical protein